MSDNTEKPKIQCFCKWEKDDTDYKGFFKTKFIGKQVIAFIRVCHKCGKYRMSLKESDPKYDKPIDTEHYTKSTNVPATEAPKATQQQMF